MKKFLKYCAIFFAPILILLVLYLILDPFKVVRHYDYYYPTDGSPLYINNNRSYVSTRMYLQNNDTMNYDSFIFGSSRSGYYMVRDWQKHIGGDAKCFHMDGYGESFYLLHKKICFLNGKSQLKNVLICIEPELLWQKHPFSGHIYVTPIEIDDYKQWETFHSSHLRAYFDWRFLCAYYYWLATDSVVEYMRDWHIIDFAPCPYRPCVNERNAYAQSEILLDTFYTLSTLSLFEKSRRQETNIWEAQLGTDEKQKLQEIADVLKANNSNYRVIVNPMCDQRLLHPDDVEYMQKLFGKNFFDFSGKNVFTDDYHNYYEPSHFTDRVAAKIMDIVYELDSARQQYLMDSVFYR